MPRSNDWYLRRDCAKGFKNILAAWSKYTYLISAFQMIPQIQAFESGVKYGGSAGGDDPYTWPDKSVRDNRLGYRKSEMKSAVNPQMLWPSSLDFAYTIFDKFSKIWTITILRPWCLMASPFGCFFHLVIWPSSKKEKKRRKKRFVPVGLFISLSECMNLHWENANEPLLYVDHKATKHAVRCPGKCSGYFLDSKKPTGISCSHTLRIAEWVEKYRSPSSNISLAMNHENLM